MPEARSRFELPAPQSCEIPGALDSTRATLETYDNPGGFEDLALILLQAIEPSFRGTGGPGDRARDGVGGLFRSHDDDEFVASISLEREWEKKIARELQRIAGFGWTPTTILAVTNRKTTS